MANSQFPEMVPRVEPYGSQRNYRTRDIRYHFRASRCQDCGEVYFPPREDLFCPNCNGRSFETYYPPKTGEVVTDFVDDIGYPPVGYNDGPPRTIVIVRLDDGVHVLSEVVELEGASAEPSTRVRMVLRKHKREDNGNWVYGYKFIVDRPG